MALAVLSSFQQNIQGDSSKQWISPILGLHKGLLFSSKKVWAVKKGKCSTHPILLTRFEIAVVFANSQESDMIGLK